MGPGTRRWALVSPGVALDGPPRGASRVRLAPSAKSLVPGGDPLPGGRPAARGWLCLVLAGVLSAAACGRERAAPAGAAAGADRYLKPDTEEIAGTVARDATLAALLRAHLAPEHADAAVQVIARAMDPRRLRAGRPFTLTRTLDGRLRAFRCEIDADQYLRVEPPSPESPRDLAAEIVAYARREEPAVAEGRIDAAAPSLFQAMEAAGESVDLSIELAAIFSGEIDFNSELQPGDAFRLAFRRILRENGTVAYGPIAVAELDNGGRRLQAYRFVPPGGQASYYDASGRSLKRFFLKSPLRFEPRITSRFSYSRRHPVLNVRRAHLGVDYAAPAGAPVVAVAHGTVSRAGVAGDAGRLVAVRHASGYESMYLHLSSIAVRVGQRVAQGDLVGRVGSSGLSTGPHLDYRLRKNGVYVNPITEHRRMPPGDPIPAALMADFLACRDRAAALLSPPR